MALVTSSLEFASNSQVNHEKLMSRGFLGSLFTNFTPVTHSGELVAQATLLSTPYLGVTMVKFTESLKTQRPGIFRVGRYEFDIGNPPR